MTSTVPGGVSGMVGVLVEARASFGWRAQGGGMPLGVASARAGVSEGTLRLWGCGRRVPSLRLLVRWAAVFDRRVALTDRRGLRWDEGVEPFGSAHWGDPVVLDEFARAEARRLGYALRRARLVSGVPLWRLSTDIGVASLGNVELWESGKQFARLGLFVRWADAVGLCASLEPLDLLPREAGDYPVTALRLDDERGGVSGAGSCR